MSKFKDKTVCFTGHRKIIHKNLEERIIDVISTLAEDGFLYFLTGGAYGFDTVAARCVLRAKEKYPDIKLIIVLPCRDNVKFSSDDIYYKIMNSADKVVCLSEKYYRGCMHVRNKKMVDESSVCVSYLYNCESGGTAFTVNYAKRMGLTVVNII